MTTEFEAKFLHIDPVSFRKKLRELSATLIFSEKMFERWNFDFSDMRLDQKNGWVRLREGEPDGNWTLAYKQVSGQTIDGVKEVEFAVPSSETAIHFLHALGLVAKSHQQRKREQWKLSDVEIDIDTWPWIPSYVEIEGPSEDAVRRCAALLGFNYAEAVFGSATEVYAKYNFPNINAVRELSFDATPVR